MGISQMGGGGSIASAMADADLSRLLAALHSGLFEPSPWATFLTDLRRVTGADYANLVFRRRDAAMNELTALFDGQAPPEELARRYLDSVYKIDPLPYHALSPGRIYALPELIGNGGGAADDFVTEFLAPSAMDYLRIVRVTEPGGYDAWLTLSRAGTDFAPAIQPLFATVAGHFAIALRSFAAIEQARRHSAIYEAALERLDVGFLTLDAQGRLVDSDDHVARLLDDGRVVARGAGGRLILHAPAAAKLLRLALKEAGTGVQRRPRVIPFSEAPRMDMLLVPSARPAVAGRRTPILTAYIHGGSRGLQERTDQLIDMFSLTRTEARLALALSQGHAIKTAAVEIGITHETARFYLKQVFAKTGTRRQADLVRRILTSVLVLS